VNKMKLLGFNFEKIILKYIYDASMLKYKLRKFIDGSEYHTLLLARSKGGRLFGGYFTSPSTYYNLIGTAELFLIGPY
jgi:hypothetical protein